MKDLRNGHGPVLGIPHLQAMLWPHVGRFSRSIWPIEEMYAQIPAELRLRLHSGAQAMNMNAFMCSLAKSEFSGVEGVQVSDDLNGSVHVLIDGTECGLGGSVVCRFKKLDDGNRSNNYQTKRQQAMRQNLPLPGLPDDATYVDIGYALNDLGKMTAAHAVRLVDSMLIISIPKDLALPLPSPQPLPGFEPNTGGGALFSLIIGDKGKIEK